jgi:hypothetical protein
VVVATHQKTQQLSMATLERAPQLATTMYRCTMVGHGLRISKDIRNHVWAWPWPRPHHSCCTSRVRATVTVVPTRHTTRVLTDVGRTHLALSVAKMLATSSRVSAALRATIGSVRTRSDAAPIAMPTSPTSTAHPSSREPLTSITALND